TNVFPSRTLGCGAAAGNITSDNIGPQHLINIKRIASVVRKAEEAFEYTPGAPNASAGPIDRPAVVAAVERYLAARGYSSGGSAAEAAGSRASSATASVIATV